eukprot:2345471-Pleurochrysis_carterae.AAC.2
MAVSGVSAENFSTEIRFQYLLCIVRTVRVPTHQSRFWPTSVFLTSFMNEHKVGQFHKLPPGLTEGKVGKVDRKPSILHLKKFPYRTLENKGKVHSRHPRP